MKEISFGGRQLGKTAALERKLMKRWRAGGRIAEIHIEAGEIRVTKWIPLLRLPAPNMKDTK